MTLKDIKYNQPHNNKKTIITANIYWKFVDMYSNIYYLI